ncbi:MAG: FadR family transcriptional regulator [Chitinophagaceae bacterium]|nr:FadR family transcriptional regulator [Chitinophagaceae bacterium]
MSNNPHNKSLDRITKTSMVDVVELRLHEYIKENAIKPGDPLPKELELAETLGISRNVVREALSRLKMFGMISTKKKIGMVLTQPDILKPLETVLAPSIIDESTLHDIFELRLTLEVGLADLLFIRKTKKDIDELEKIAKSQKIVPGKHAFRIKNEIAFHGKMYQMTGNRTMQRFQDMLLPVFGYIVRHEKELMVGKTSHLDLVNLLRDGSKEEFRQGMLEHLQYHFDQLK